MCQQLTERCLGVIAIKNIATASRAAIVQIFNAKQFQNQQTTD